MNTATLQYRARLVRSNIIAMLEMAGSGHSAGPLGLSDILTYLYAERLNVRSDDPSWSDRDRVVLSCGHYAPVLYSALAEAGYFPRRELQTLRKLGSRLQGHPHNGSLPGIETSSGPLGQGLSQAIGMVQAAKLQKADWRVVTLLSDGEQQEGQIWEAVLYAGAKKVPVIAVLDRNGIQIDGRTEDVMPLDSLTEKYRSFRWEVIEINGHDFNEIHAAFNRAWEVHDHPVVIIAATIPGKGVDFMEGDYTWHGKPPTTDQAHEALTSIWEGSV